MMVPLEKLRSWRAKVREAKLNKLRAKNERIRRGNEELRTHVNELINLLRSEKPEIVGAIERSWLP